jgi:hypothetical protein
MECTIDSDKHPPPSLSLLFGGHILAWRFAIVCDLGLAMDASNQYTKEFNSK